MRCENCGTENNFEWAKFCRNCEQPLYAESDATSAIESVAESHEQEAGSARQVIDDADIVEIGVSDPMDFIMGSANREASSADTQDTIKPEPIENELTLYRDEDVKLSISESKEGSKMVVEALQDDFKITAEGITPLEAAPAQESSNEQSYQMKSEDVPPEDIDPSDLQQDTEKLLSTQKIPIVKDEDQSEILQKRNPRLEPESMTLSNVTQSHGVVYLSGKTLKLTGGVKLSIGDEVTINDRIFDVKNKPGKGMMFYLGIGGSVAVLFLCLLFLINRNATDIGQLAGSVIGNYDGKPLPGQTVTLTELNQTSVTNQAGFFVFDKIPAGIYTISFLNQNGATSQEKVTVLDDQTSTVALREKVPEEKSPEQPQAAGKPIQAVQNETAAKPGKGTLKLSIEPPNASVFADDKPLGVGSNSYKLSPGVYTITARKSGYAEKSQKVTIEAEQALSVRLALPEISQADVSPRSNAELALEQETAGNYRDALKYYDRILTRNPREIPAILGKARCLRREGKIDEATSNFLQASKLAADKGDTRLQLEAISGVIEMKPNTFTAYTTRGELLYQLGQYDKAVSDFAKVIEMDGRNLGAYYKIGDCFYKIQNYNEALRAFQAARELNFADPKAEACLAKTYLALGDKKNTKKSYEKFNELASYSTRLEFQRDPEWQKVLATLGVKE